MVMGKKYKQLGIEERERIIIMKTEGKSLRYIGKASGRSHATIVRELKRNAAPVNKGYYLPHKADERAKVRKRESGERERLKKPAIRNYVHRWMPRGWSPEQVAGRWSKRHPDCTISHEAVYQYVHAGQDELIGCLPRRHKKRHVKGHSRKHKVSHIPNRIAITDRPAPANNRTQFGHWESDSMVSRASKAALCVQNERKSRYTKITKLARKTASLPGRPLTAVWRVTRKERGEALPMTTGAKTWNTRRSTPRSARSHISALRTIAGKKGRLKTPADLYEGTSGRKQTSPTSPRNRSGKLNEVLITGRGNVWVTIRPPRSLLN